MKPTDVMHPSWGPIRKFLNEDPLVHLRNEVLPNIIYYPERQNIFRVFSLPVSDINIVILGQDPYHGPGQATGLAFSVKEDIPMPPSLRVIAKEIEAEGLKSGFYDSDIAEWKNLKHWHRQGIFLLNTALTVESGKAGMHIPYWENFTHRVINFISSKNPCVWLLWGKRAQRFMPYINNSLIVKNYDKETITQIPLYKDTNYVLTAAHPAAEMYNTNAGFLGCNHFLFASEIVKKQKNLIINW